MRLQENIELAWININRTCNLRCKWCYAKGSKYSQVMAIDDAYELLEVLHEYGIKTINLIGGEPTQHPNFINIVKQIKQMGIRCSVVTNGLLFKDAKFLNKVKEAGVDSINVSVKGICNDDYLKHTGFAVYDDVVQSIKNVINSHIPLTVSYVLTDESIDNIEIVMKTFRDIGVKSFYISLCNPTICNDKIYDDDIQIKEIIHKFIAFYNNFSFDGIFNFKLHQNLPMCFWPNDFIKKLNANNHIITTCILLSRSGLVFDENANLILCNSLYDYQIGAFRKDYKNAEELSRCLNSEKTLSLYRELLKSPSHKCKTCSQFSFCAGGCILQRFNKQIKNMF